MIFIISPIFLLFQTTQQPVIRPGIGIYPAPQHQNVPYNPSIQTAQQVIRPGIGIYPQNQNLPYNSPVQHPQTHSHPQNLIAMQQHQNPQNLTSFNPSLLAAAQSLNPAQHTHPTHHPTIAHQQHIQHPHPSPNQNGQIYQGVQGNPRFANRNIRPY